MANGEGLAIPSQRTAAQEGLVNGDGMVSWMVETIDTLSSSMAILQWLER